MMRRRFVVRTLSDRWRDRRTWLLAAVTVGLVLAARAFVPSPAGARIPGLWLPPCPFRAVTRLPCPFCGLTTAAAYLARGDVADAWRTTALAPAAGALFALSAVYIFGLRLLGGRRVDLADRASRRALWLIACGIVLAAWGVNLLRHFA